MIWGDNCILAIVIFNIAVIISNNFYLLDPQTSERLIGSHNLDFANRGHFSHHVVRLSSFLGLSAAWFLARILQFTPVPYFNLAIKSIYTYFEPYFVDNSNSNLGRKSSNQKVYSGMGETLWTSSSSKRLDKVVVNNTCSFIPFNMNPPKMFTIMTAFIICLD